MLLMSTSDEIPFSSMRNSLYSLLSFMRNEQEPTLTVYGSWVPKKQMAELIPRGLLLMSETNEIPFSSMRYSCGGSGSRP